MKTYLNNDGSLDIDKIYQELEVAGLKLLTYNKKDKDFYADTFKYTKRFVDRVKTHSRLDMIDMLLNDPFSYSNLKKDLAILSELN